MQHHARGISADRLVYKIADAGEAMYGIEFLFDFFL
jgi:hypothetical protein